MEYLLHTNGLTKQYGRHKAVNAVNIHIRQGDIYGLIGRNGAGKTTDWLLLPKESFRFLERQEKRHTSICLASAH